MQKTESVVNCRMEINWMRGIHSHLRIQLAFSRINTRRRKMLTSLTYCWRYNDDNKSIVSSDNAQSGKFICQQETL